MWCKHMSNFVVARLFSFSPSPLSFPLFILLLSLSLPSFINSALQPGIPTLIILDEEGNVITSQGRAAVTSDPDGKVSHAHHVVFSELMLYGTHDPLPSSL